MVRSDGRCLRMSIIAVALYQGFVLERAIRRCPLLQLDLHNRLSVSDGRLHYMLPACPSAHVQPADRCSLGSSTEVLAPLGTLFGTRPEVKRISAPVSAGSIST